MKKVLLTIAALAVSAVMIFSFAGCTGDDATTDAAGGTAEDGSNTPAVVTEVEDTTLA